MVDVSNLNKTDIKKLLKDLKLLNSLKKSLWSRWQREFDRIKNNIDSYIVEYFEVCPDTLPFFKEKAVILYKKLFWLDLDSSQITFVPNNNLQGWLRIFLNDTMYDLSYSRFERLLK